jgi:hypothetical protein
MAKIIKIIKIMSVRDKKCSFLHYYRFSGMPHPVEFAIRQRKETPSQDYNFLRDSFGIRSG